MSPTISIFVLAVGLAMDAFAASLAQGSKPRLTPLGAVGTAGAFGLFQAGMPLLGLAVGMALAPVIADIDHWIAFILLTVIGLQMIREGLSGDGESESGSSASDVRTVLMLALATSIDAAVAGVTLPMMGLSIPLALAIIGGVTFALSLTGLALGKVIGTRLGKSAELLGGTALILLGTKILIEHLSA